MENIFITILIIFVFLLSAVFIIVALRGYDKAVVLSLRCSKCGNIFKPEFFRSGKVLFPRDAFFYSFFKVPVFTKCPKCGKRSWHRVIKDTEVNQ